MTPIDLGKTDALCCPSPHPTSDVGPKYYPGVYLTLPPGTAIPKEGTIEFKFKLHSVKADLKADTVCVDIELLALLEAEPSGADSLKTVEQALEEYEPEED